MNIEIHQVNNTTIAEITAQEIIIKNASDGLDLLGNMYYQGFDKIIIYEININNDFFDLKNGIAGEILQKFSNYRIKLAIIGDFTSYSSKSLNDFMLESNKFGHINFVRTLSEAIEKLSK